MGSQWGRRPSHAGLGAGHWAQVVLVMLAAAGGFVTAPWVEPLAAPVAWRLLGPVSTGGAAGRPQADARGQARPAQPTQGEGGTARQAGEWVPGPAAVGQLARWALVPARPGAPEEGAAVETPVMARPPSPEPSSPARPPRAPAAPGRITPGAGEVWVAVYHTHTSEMYRTPDFHPEDPGRYHRFGTQDTGIIRVGTALVQALNDFGVPAVHDTTLHDQVNFEQAYGRSRETVRRLAARYPHLKLLIDLHRDAPQEGGELVTSIDGQDVAQVALVLALPGGRGGPSPPNAATAQALAQVFEAHFPGLLRRVIQAPGRTYNQDQHPGAVLIEIGSYRTDETAAVRAARRMAQAIALLLVRYHFTPGRGPITVL